MIIVEKLNVEFNGYIVLKNIDIVFDKGLHVIMGRNGSGKTTLLKTIAGIIKPSSGRVIVFNKDIHRIPRSEAVKLVGYVWQNPYAGFIEATVFDEINFTAKLIHTSLNKEIVEKLVPKHLLYRNPYTLSGGEAKRVSIASILSIDQPVWLFDEPFDYLDNDGVSIVKKLIEYGLERGKIVIIASANPSYLHLFKPVNILVLFNGEIVLKTSSLNEADLGKYGVPSREIVCG
ncbi:MAG: energy-coupling factor ABC transporter ATP-binding protein [Desulfurococcaceae archaeon]